MVDSSWVLEQAAISLKGLVDSSWVLEQAAISLKGLVGSSWVLEQAATLDLKLFYAYQSKSIHISLDNKSDPSKQFYKEG